MAIVEASFAEPELNASPCEFKFALPKFSYLLNLPGIPFPPSFIPVFTLSLSLTCSLDNPIDVSAGIAYGGGRTPKFDPDPDSQPDEDDGGGTRARGGF